MYRKAVALFASSLMILSALAAVAGAASGTAGPLVVPAGPRGPTPDNDSEPNNDFGNATLITGSASFSGVVGYGDFDYFKVNLNTGATADTLDVQLTCHNGITRLQIYDPNGYEILNDGPGNALRLTFTAFISGYYYIYLPNMGPCDYTITTAKGTQAFSSDNDNTPATATAISPSIGNPYTTIGTMNNDTDVHDFYKVRLNYSEGISTDVLKAFLDIPSTGAFGLELYAAGSPLALLTMFNPVNGGNQTMTYSPTASGDYYLRAWGVKGSGQYTLKVSKFTGTADQNGDRPSAGALSKTDAHWYNTTGDLTLGIDPDDFYMVEGVVIGQTFNCTLTSNDYDPSDLTPDIRIILHNDTDELQPDPYDNLADPVAHANSRMHAPGNFYVQLNLTEWAGAFDLTVFTNSPPEVVSQMANITFPENSTNTTIRLSQVFSDPEDDPLSYSYELFGENLQGNVDIKIGTDADRTVTIMPKSGWRGVFSMDLTATDPFGESVTTTVQQVWVYGINHRPEIANASISTMLLAKGVPDTSTLNLALVFQDPDLLDRLVYTVTGNYSIRVSFPKEAANGIWPTGEVFLVPDLDFVGTEMLVFTATDNGIPPLTSEPVAVTVDVRENLIEKVTSTEIPRLVMLEDSAEQTVNIAPNFNSNFAGDTFTFEYLGLNTSHLNVNLAADGKVTILPAEEWNGIEVLRFRATCQHGLNATATLTVEVKPVNDLPVFGSWTPVAFDQNITEGESIMFRINVSDEEMPLAQLKVNWTLDGVKVSSFQEYNFTTDYNTVLTSEGSRKLVLRVAVNDTLATVFLSWNVTVVNLNRAPGEVRITFPPDGSSYEEGAKVHFIGMALDEDGDAVTFQWYEGTKLLGAGTDFNYSKLKAGRHNITLKASDATNSGTANIIVKVNAKKSQPGFELLAVIAAVALAAVGLASGGRRRRN